jgi:hypothetical protein
MQMNSETELFGHLLLTTHHLPLTKIKKPLVETRGTSSTPKKIRLAYRLAGSKMRCFKVVGIIEKV